MTAPTLETRHLRLLLAVDETGSLNAAARELNLTPSALSQQLRDLEMRLGGPLFHRAWRRMATTAAGRRLVDAARATLPELARAEHDARGLIGGRRGTIRVATACYLSYRWLPRLLRAFADTRPEVDVVVVSEAAEAPLAWLRERRLDVALVVGGRERDRALRDVPLFRDEIVAVVGRGHSWFGRRSVPASAFADVHYYGDPTFLQADRPLGRALATAGAAPQRVTAIPMAAGVPLEMARANLGVTVMARWAAEPALEGGDLHAVRVGPKGLWIQWSLVTRSEPPEAALSEFVDAFHHHYPRAAAENDG